MGDTPDARAQRWLAKAEEIRVDARSMGNKAGGRPLRQMARYCEAMAERAEAEAIQRESKGQDAR